jgi:glycosyltransferase involved in cell wall biosynthesis
MKISFNQTTGPNVKTTNGYGYAAQMCKESLATLGHEVNWRDETADIEINFIQPEHWHWTGVDYRIGYLPWESTLLHEGWVEKMNELDEVWTPSPIIGEWFVDQGVTKPVKIYQHGVEPAWEPVLRSLDPSERMHFIHHGAEALRKGGNDSISAFQRVLWDENATLVMKMQLDAFNVHDTDHIKVRKNKIPFMALVELYQSCHAMVYPSWGEGFGLAPLQAMATGMPVLITKGWAPYEYLLPEAYLIESELVDSPWPYIHPGKMFKPDQDDLDAKLRNLFDNHEEHFQFSYDLTKKVQEDYNWLELTEAAFAHLS